MHVDGQLGGISCGHSSRDCPGNWLGHKVSAAAAWVLFESSTPVALYKLQPVLD